MGNKQKPGDVIAIPLPDGNYAYGKLFNDASIGIYDLISENVIQFEKVTIQPIDFFSGVFDTAIKNGTWEKIGHEPFESEDNT